MKTSSAKAKGRRLCAEIRELLYKYAPDLRPGDIEITSSGANGVDIKLSPAAVEKYPLAIECKNQERLNIWEALAQAKGHCASSSSGPVWIVPAVFFRRNNGEAYVALSADDFVRLTVT